MDLVDKGWAQMSSLLAEEMPQKDRKGSPFPWFLLLLLLLASFAGVYAYLTNNGTEMEKTAKVALVGAVDHQNSNPLSLSEQSVKKQNTELNSSLESSKTPTVPAEAGRNLGHTDGGALSVNVNSNSYSTGINKELTENNSTEREDEFFEDNPQSQIKTALNGIVKLDAAGISLFPMGMKALAAAPEIMIGESMKKVALELYGQLNAGSNFNKNLNLGIQGGIEYKLLNNWHASTSLGYRLDRIVSQDIFRSAVNFDVTTGIIESSNDGNWADVRNSSDLQIRYKNITQHIISLNQGLSYHIPYAKSEKHFRVELRGQIAYAVGSTSSSDLTMRSPLIVNGATSYLIAGISPDRIKEYVPKWYYGVDLAIGIDLSEHWSLETSLSVLQAIDQESDQLNIDLKRGLSYSLGIRRAF